jgi:hypothetical protein
VDIATLYCQVFELDEDLSLSYTPNAEVPRSQSTLL